MPASDEVAAALVETGKRCSLTKSVPAEWARRGTPRQVEFLLAYLEAEAESTRSCAASSGEAGAESITPNDWQDVPLNTLMVFREGEEIYRGTAHSEEFFFDEEKMRLLFLDYAGM